MPEPKTVDLTNCDLEPIHIPGSIQPYGTMLIADADSGIVEGFAGPDGSAPILGLPLAELTGLNVQALVGKIPASGLLVLGRLQFGGRARDGVAYRSGGHLVVELTDPDENADLDAQFLAQLETLGATLERSTTLADLSNRAAGIFQRLTGYSRVMVYRFIDDEAGVVLGESISDRSSSFMNHHFPATDIPRQARALYVRNKVRVIADVQYEPAPIVSASRDLTSIDLSDSTLRSVSPIHIQYLKNMEVGASASMSIVVDGVLWGLIACHHHQPRELSLTTRLACQAMATSLARQVKARDEGELYRERIALRAQEDAILARLGTDSSLVEFFARSGEELAALLQADGFAAVQGGELFRACNCPDPADVRQLAEHVRHPGSLKPVASRELSKDYPAAAAFQESASGLLAVTMSTEVPTILMWFRAEQLQTVKWAGNPHKDVPHEPGAVLKPRASFEAWSESVRGRSRPWTLAQTESASRVVRLMTEARNNSRIKQLNRELTTTLNENESLIRQKDFLLREVNHRVQNSLALVGAFLRMQGRNAGEEVRAHLAQAESRLSAVGLAHRRLYQDDSVEIIDLSRYLTELVDELLKSMDERWRRQVTLDLVPMLISTDRAVSVGLIVNELVTNVTKYAYGGEPGPLLISLQQHRDMLRLIVADSGRGYSGVTEGTGFGSRMLASLVQRLGGSMEIADNSPGARVIVAAAIQA
ncbi:MULTISPECIES: histidine kinase dimerization/phosphoacceptor domain -containing protein [unclassified Devosia]|uniref:histidine kinase dimerization/phosphoacceptor domain -containing protein n=1 Tax=unclassified Devosia TaxID=196773 RepID=UPI0020BED250|nr:MULTISPECIES: histidine kinase dimerization/phosphoacceptor domain -containing protein [unclassified Devosia]